jgi:hypothetical protein
VCVTIGKSQHLPFSPQFLKQVDKQTYVYL